MNRDFIFYFSGQWAFYLDQESVFCYAVGRPPQKRIFCVLYKANLVGLAAGPGVVQVASHGLEKSSVGRSCVPGPGPLQDFFCQKIVRFFVAIVT